MKLGTRGSKLALIQTQKVVEALKATRPDIKAEIIIIQTSGDWKPSHGERLLAEAEGGKGLFAKEIEMALLDGVIDVGVHSLKDVPTTLDNRLRIDHTLERDDPRDAFISDKAGSIDELPAGAVIGTSSMRRKCILLSRRSDLEVVPLRGNVDTRLRKMREGQVDATFLAACGLHRMGLQHEITSYLEPESMLPAVCQGIIAMETRADDTKTADILNAIHDNQTHKIALAERAVLSVLDGSCRTPIGSYGQWMDDDKVRLRALVASSDGSDVCLAEETAKVKTNEDAYALGLRVGQTLKSKTPTEYLQIHA